MTTLVMVTLILVIIVLVKINCSSGVTDRSNTLEIYSFWKFKIHFSKFAQGNWEDPIHYQNNFVKHKPVDFWRMKLHLYEILYVQVN